MSLSHAQAPSQGQAQISVGDGDATKGLTADKPDPVEETGVVLAPVAQVQAFADNSLLCQAALSASAQEIRVLLDQIPEAQRPAHVCAVSGKSGPLLIAARRGDVEVIEVLLTTLRSPPQVNAPDHFGVTALMLAAEHGHLGVVRALLAALQTAEAASEWDEAGSTALMKAAQNGHLEVVRELMAMLRTSNDAYLPIREARAALVVAARVGRVDVLRELTAALPTPDYIGGVGAEGRTALTAAALHGKLEAVRELMLVVNALDAIQEVDDHGSTAMTAAARNGHLDVVRTFLALLGTPEASHVKNEIAVTALMSAAGHGHIEVVREVMAFLESPEAISATGATGFSALMFAVQRGRHAIVDILVEAMLPQPGAISAFGSDGETALSLAVGRGGQRTIEMLLNAMQRNGRAPGSPAEVDHRTIVTAATYDRLGVLNTWLASGASEALVETFLSAHQYFQRGLNAVGHTGRTALMQAAESGYAHVVAVLIKNQADTEVRLRDGSRALELAARNGHLNVLEAWLQAGLQVPDEVLEMAEQAIVVNVPNHSQKGSSILLGPASDDSPLLTEMVIERFVRTDLLSTSP